MGAEDTLARFAPCGLDCGRCFARTGGAVQEPALELRSALTGFEALASRIVRERAPVLAGYDEFAAVLEFLCQAGCSGCRAGGGHLPTCAARTCHLEKAVDFCYQCDEYPCARNSFHPALTDKWRRYNDRLREVGLEQFAAEQDSRPRFE